MPLMKKMSPMMKAAKIPVMQKSKKQAALSKKSTTLGSLKKKKGKGEVIKNTKKSPFAAKAKSSSEEGMKTRATSNRASLDSLMANFQMEGRAKTALGMPLKDFSESATALL